MRLMRMKPDWGEIRHAQRPVAELHSVVKIREHFDGLSLRRPDGDQQAAPSRKASVFFIAIILRAFGKGRRPARGEPRFVETYST